ncbi:MAG: phytanoyl-CoA dioxygenase family protein [Actinomycetota bacterium]
MTVTYDDALGWARIDDLVSPERARSIAETCLAILADPSAARPADKPHGGTRRLAEALDRVPEIGSIVDAVAPTVSEIIPSSHRLTEATFRCPSPGFGEQKLHADTMPKLAPGPDTVATVIVALTEFTERNGSTRVLPGSHHRPDLQRQAGQLDSTPGLIALVGPAGTGFVFSGHLLHAGARNDGDHPRPALQLVFRAEGEGQDVMAWMGGQGMGGR